MSDEEMVTVLAEALPESLGEVLFLHQSQERAIPGFVAQEQSQPLTAYGEEVLDALLPVVRRVVEQREAEAVLRYRYPGISAAEIRRMTADATGGVQA